MSAADLLTWLRAVPFRPFRITLNSGRAYDIRHPEMLRVGKTRLNVYSFTGPPSDPFERMEMVSLLLVEHVEPIEAAAPASGEGP